ncbi:MAG: carboxypeptidase regulatory-like domain-containing protein [Bacteroidales bacterium]|nr:carboxypeptidase regulatory-like domain-containing protein [Bacteroidales bacterium]
MKRFTTYLFLLLLTQYAISQTVSLNIQVFQDDPWVPEPVTVEGASVTISNPDLLPGGTTATTNANGIASFTIDQPATGTLYDLEISKAGYNTLIAKEWNGIYVSEWTEFPYTARKTLLKNYYASFTITDESDLPISGAQIIVSAYTPEPDTMITDANGQAVFQRTASWDGQDFTVSADGFADTTSSFVIDLNGADVNVPVLKMVKAYPVTLTIEDAGNNPLENALVRLTGYGVSDELTSNASGQVSFLKRVNGNYSYMITLSGYVDNYGSVAVADGDPNASINLTSGYDLNFTIINGSSGDVGLQGDTITIDGKTKITGPDGKLSFGVAAGSSYTFTNVKAGFISVPVDIQNIQANTDLIINMVPDYNLTFSILDFAEYFPIEGAMVSFNGMNVLSDASGQVSFTHVTPSETPYEYTITSPDGDTYKTSTGAVNLPIASESYQWDFNNISQTIILEKSYAFIGLADGWFSYFGVATITFDGIDYEYNAGLGGNYFFADPGTYNYTVTPEDAGLAILSGSLTITETESASLFLNIVPGYKLEIYAVDANMDAVEGAAVSFNNQTIMTDASGLAQFNRVAGGEYTYSVSKDGYTGISDAALTVATEDVLEIARLATPGYAITFTVTDGVSPIAGATVEVGSETGTTDASGMAVFNDRVNGSYDYTVTAAGYQSVASSVSVSDADANENVSMSEMTYTLTFTVTDGSNPIMGATITIGSTSISTDASGMAKFEGLSNGSYDYTVTADGFLTINSSVVVNAGDKSESLTMASTLGIGNYSDIKLRAYPNPTNGLFSLEFSNKQASVCRIQVINMRGSILQDIEVANSVEKLEIDLSEYVSGIYQIKVIRGSENSLIRVIRN